MNFNDPGFLEWIATGQMPPGQSQPMSPQDQALDPFPPQQPPPQPPQVRPLAPLPFLGKHPGFQQAMVRSDAANKNYAQATADQSAVQGFIGQQAQAGQQQAVEESQAQAQANQAKREEEQARTAAGTKELRGRIQAYASEGVDPLRLVHNAETWQKVVMGISMAISGFLNPRGPNLAFEAILKLIDRDTQGQEVNLAKKGKQLDMDRQMNMDDEKTSRQSYIEAEEKRMTLLELAKQRANTEAQKLGANASAQANNQLLQAKLDQELEERSAKLYGEIEKTKISAGVGYQANAETRRYHDVQFAQHNMDAAMDATKESLDRSAKKEGSDGVPKGKAEVFDPQTGRSLGLVNLGQERTWQELIGEHNQMRQALLRAGKENKSMDAWDKAPGAGLLGADTPRDVQGDLAFVQDAYVKWSHKGGALTNTELLPLRKIIPEDANGWFRANPQRRIEKAVQMLDEQMMALAKARGLSWTPPAASQTSVDEKRKQLLGDDDIESTGLQIQ